MCLIGIANPRALTTWAEQIKNEQELSNCRSQFRKTTVILTVIVLAAIASLVIGTLALKGIYFNMTQTAASVCIGLGGAMILYNIPDIKRLYDTNQKLNLQRTRLASNH